MRGIISLSATLLTVTWYLVELNTGSSIASICLLSITFRCKIFEYTHVWLKLLIVVVLPNSYQAPVKWMYTFMKHWILPLTDAVIWDKYGAETCHDTRPGLIRQIAIKWFCDLPQSLTTNVHKIHHAVSVENHNFVLSYSIDVVSTLSIVLFHNYFYP